MTGKDFIHYNITIQSDYTAQMRVFIFKLGYAERLLRGSRLNKGKNIGNKKDL